MWETYLSDYEKEQEEFLESCYQGEVQRVKEVVANKTKHPIDPRGCLTDQGKNGIHLATISGSYRNIEIIRVLKSYNVDINGRTKHQQRSPLMLGVITANQLAVEELLKLGAEVGLQDYQGNSALHHACIYSQETITRILLFYSPPLTAKNLKGQTPIDLAKPSLLEIISKHEANKEAAHRAEELLSSRLESKAELDTEEGGFSGWGREEKMEQIAIKSLGLSSFKKLSLLGRGAFGEVFLA